MGYDGSNNVDGESKFYASPKNPLARNRRHFAIGGAIGAIVTILVQGRSIGSALFTLAIFLIIFGLIDYFVRRQLRPGEPVITLTDAFIASPNLSGKNKQLAWKDIEYTSVTAIQSTQIIEFVLRNSSGIRNHRSFWTGINPAKPRLPLSAFSPEDQEKLYAEILQRQLKSCSPDQLENLTTPLNDLRAAREFEETMKALQPHTWITYGLIAANVVIWVATLMQGAGFTQSPAGKLLLWGGNAASEVQKGEWWRLLSATFLHSGFLHVTMNMLGLYSAGVTLERIYGKRLYLLIYLASGLAGSALSLHFSAQRVVSVGASGAVFGITGALLVAVFQHRDKLPKIFSRQTISGLTFFILYSLIEGFSKQGIDNAAHVGGLLGGCLSAFILPERFDMSTYQRSFMKRVVAAITIMACVTTSLAMMAPAAAIDQGKIAASAEILEHGLRKFDKGMRELQQEMGKIKSGTISKQDADERSRTVLAPIFREIVADLSQVTLRQEDPRLPFVKDIRRMSELLADSLGMESVYNEATEEYEPIDPVKSERITKELNKVSERVAGYFKKGAPKR